MWCADVITGHPYNNVTENIFQKIGANLHQRPDHPLCIIKNAIYAYFDEQHPGKFQKFDNLYPVVTAKAVRPTSQQWRLVTNRWLKKELTG
jgi:phenylalanyl-tRNA synthetase alpha chain